MLQSPRSEVLDEAREREALDDANHRFDDLLDEVEALAGIERTDEALETCWSARRLAKRTRLQRVGEADLTIGRLLLDLGRMNEGLEALHRAVRYFSERGQLTLRGLAEALLAEAAWQRGDDRLAGRHLEIASELLVTSDDRRSVSAALRGQAERLESKGRCAAASCMRREAQRLGVGAAAV